MSQRGAAWLAWGWFGLLAALTALAAVVVAFEPIGPIWAAVRAGMVSGWRGLVILGLGALLASRRPGNAVGPLLMATGTAYVVPFDEIAVAVSRFPGATEAPWWPILMLANSLTILLYLFPLPFLLLLFPNGRIPSPRWRWLLRTELIVLALTVAMTVLNPQWGPEAIAIANPLASVYPSWFASVAAVVSGALIIAIFSMPVAGAVSLLARYRGAGVQERTQIRWLLFAGALYAVLFILSTLLSDTALSTPLFAIGLAGIPVAVTIAILRHRLFDIDVIIRRSLQYGVLTAILGGLYAGSVLLVQVVLAPLVGGVDSPPVVVVTTLALAALFDPLRVRVQRWIDRSFYREKVDARRAVARFAALARDEVDLDELRGALFGVVGEALRPERIGLWLRDPEPVAERER